MNVHIEDKMKYLRLIKYPGSLCIVVCEKSGGVFNFYGDIAGICEQGFVVTPLIPRPIGGISLGLDGRISIAKTILRAPMESYTVSSKKYHLYSEVDGAMHLYRLSGYGGQVTLETWDAFIGSWWYVFTITEDGCLYRHDKCSCGWLKTDIEGRVSLPNHYQDDDN